MQRFVNHSNNRILSPISNTLFLVCSLIIFLATVKSADYLGRVGQKQFYIIRDQQVRPSKLYYLFSNLFFIVFIYCRTGPKQKINARKGDTNWQQSNPIWNLFSYKTVLNTDTFTDVSNYILVFNL